jgi:predicted transcriptional regulator of viral defense system
MELFVMIRYNKDDKLSNGVISIRGFIEDLQASGRYVFSRDEIQSNLPLSPIALRHALWRQAKAGRLIAPRQGFYVIVPPEYRAAGSLPPAWFIHDLMRHLSRPYYVGLLTAAALHGASEQAPQEFQVVTDRPVRPVDVGRHRLRFIAKAHMAKTPTVAMRTPTGDMHVSTPEATAFDLVRYPSHAGHLVNVCRVLDDLAERMSARKLVRAAEAEPDLAIAQRLGFLLAAGEHPNLTGPLAGWLAARAPKITPLRPGRPITRAARDHRWHVAVNTDMPPRKDAS